MLIFKRQLVPHPLLVLRKKYRKFITEFAIYESNTYFLLSYKLTL